METGPAAPAEPGGATKRYSGVAAQSFSPRHGRAWPDHPRLAVLISAEGVDGGPEHVPGLDPDTHHDV
ncbi:MAG: hypothetical protein ACJ8AW_23120 [Rhodopila sp.]